MILKPRKVPKHTMYLSTIDPDNHAEVLVQAVVGLPGLEEQDNDIKGPLYNNNHPPRTHSRPGATFTVTSYTPYAWVQIGYHNTAR